MYLCQQLEQMSDRRYRRDWRVVWFKVVMLPDTTLVWHRLSSGKWRGSGYWGRQEDGATRRWIDGKGRAEKDLRENVPVWNKVFHGAKVTGKQAETLTNIRTPYGLDRLKEAGDELTMPELCNYVVKKEKPTKLDIARKRLENSQLKVDEYTKKLKRCEHFKRGWGHRVKRFQRMIDKLTMKETT
jgi:hypothetical protein